METCLGNFQWSKYSELTTPDGVTKEWRGLIIMSGVGMTYKMGATRGYFSGSHSAMGMLYLMPCAKQCLKYWAERATVWAEVKSVFSPGRTSGRFPLQRRVAPPCSAKLYQWASADSV